MSGSRPNSGFTLIELLITITIAVILMTVAVPSFLDFMRNSRITGQANDLVLAFAYAKSEAVKRGVQVTVCSRATNTACAASTTWDGGWLVFVDNDGGGTVNGADLVLQVRGQLETGNTLRAGVRQRVTFRSTGYSPGFNDTFRLCDVRGTANARQVVISAQGRATSTIGTAACP